MQAPIRSFNRKHSRTYNMRLQGWIKRHPRSIEKDNGEPIKHGGNAYLAAEFLRSALINGGFIDKTELQETVSRYVGYQGGYTPPMNLVKQRLPDDMFSAIVRMPYYDELARNYRESQANESIDDEFQ